MPRTGLFILFYILCFFSLTFADVGGEPLDTHVAVQYHLGGKGSSVQIIDSIFRYPFILPGTYRIKGQVRLKSKMESRLLPVSFLGFVRQEQARGAADLSDYAFVETWSPGSSGVARVVYEVDGNSDSFNYDDKLVVDYEDIYPDNPTMLRLELTFRDQRQGSTLVALSDFTANSALEVTKSVDCLRDGFEPRSKIYLARRELGFSGGPVWQYVEDAGRTVLQRRFNQIILDRKAKKQIAGMDFYLRPGAKVERVNLAVRVPGWPFPRRKIFEYPISPRDITLRNGQIRLRLNLTDYQLKSDDFDKIVLDEVTVFFKGDPHQVMSQMPVEKINFLQAKQKGEVDSELETAQAISFRLPEVKNLGQSRKQLVLDIGELRSRIDRLSSLNDGRQPATEYRLSQVEVIAGSKSGRRFGGIRINRMFTANDISVPVPFAISEMQGKIQRWGGPFSESLDHTADNRFEWLNILDYHFFSGAGQSWRASTYAYGMVLEKESNGLLLQSDNSKLDFKWSTGINLTEGSRFILMADSRQGAVDSVLYIFTNREGKTYRVNGFMNKPIRLPAWLNDVESVEAEVGFREDRIVSDNTKYKYALLLKNAVFFEPTTITWKELWDAPFPSEVKRNLVPVSRETEARAGGLSDGFFDIPGETSDPVSVWRTLVDRPAERLLRLEAVANIPRRVFDFQPCWLELTVHGSSHSASHRLCFPSYAGNASLDLAGFLWQSGFDSDETVKDISWNVSDDFAAVVRKGFLRLTLTENISTLRWKLSNEPLFSVNGVEYLPGDWDVDDENPVMIKFGELRVEEDEPRLDVSFIPRPYFEVDKVFFERTEPITVSQWQALQSLRNTEQRSPAGKGMGRSILFKLLLVLAGAVLVWAGVRYGVFAGMMAVFRGVMETVNGTLFLGWRPSMGQRLIFWFGVSIILYILGLLGRGQRGENYFFTFGGIAAVLAWRAYIFRARDWLREHRPRLAELLYGSEGSHYFAGAIVLLVITAFFVAVRIEAVAEQVAVLVYYMLVAGVLRELRCRLKNNGERQGIS